MFLKKSSIVYEQVNDSNNGAGGTPNGSPPAPNNQTPEPKGNLDEFGYQIKPATPPPPAAPPAPPVQNQSGQTSQQTPATPPPAADNNLGYNAPPPPPEPNTTGYGDPNTTPPPATPPPETSAATPPPPATPPEVHKVEANLEGLADITKKELSDFIQKYKIPKEAQQAFIDQRKSEIVQASRTKTEQETAVKNETARLRSTWFNELKADKEFGGNNFDANVKAVNKLLTDFFPSVKNMLTEKQGMLPPSVMKEYHNVAKKLYETESFVQGDLSGASETKQPGEFDFLDTMYPKT